MLPVAYRNPRVRSAIPPGRRGVWLRRRRLSERRTGRRRDDRWTGWGAEEALAGHPGAEAGAEGRTHGDTAPDHSHQHVEHGHDPEQAEDEAADQERRQRVA